MMLSIRTYKRRREDLSKAEYKTYRYPCVDTIAEGETLVEKLNKGFECLLEEINQDRNNNDVTKFERITICDMWFS